MADELDEKIEKLKKGEQEDAAPDEPEAELMDALDEQDAADAEHAEPNRENDSGQVNATAERADANGGGQASAVWNAREYAEKELGIPVTQRFKDDEEFQRALLAEYRQVHAENQRRAAELENYRQQLAQQAAPKQEQPAAKKKLYEVPDYDPRWESQVKFNEHGRAVAGDGGDPAIAAKVNQYNDYVRKFFSDFGRDPESTLAPLVDARAESLIEQKLGAKMEEYQRQQQASQYEQQNSHWLYQHDANGRRVNDPTSGHPVMTFAGQRFSEHVNHATRTLGLRDFSSCVNYAFAMTERDVMAAERQQSQTKNTAQQTNEQKKKEALARGQRQPERGGSLVSAGLGRKGTPQNSSLSFREQLKADLERAGFTKPEDFEN